MMTRGFSIEKWEGLRDKSRSKSRGKKSKGKCCYFNKAWNLNKDYWKRKKHNDESIKVESLAEANLGTVVEVLSGCNILQNQDKWILDLGAFDHMCPHRS